MRLWKRVDGEPYMINPRLGILAMQALNPKGRKMAKRHYGARHMAWVRSFRKKNYRSRKSHRRRKHNPYPLAGPAMALGNYRRRKHHYRKHNPGGLSSIARGTFGLPPLMPVVYGAGGFIATAAAQGFIDTLAPAGYSASTSLLAKYLEIGLGIVVVAWAAKHFISGGAAAFAAVGGGIFAVQQLVHDFLPGVIPGMHAYVPLKAYTPVRNAQSSTMGFGIEAASPVGGMPQLATAASMPQLAARAIGAKKGVDFADDGGMNIVASRFRRFN